MCLCHRQGTYNKQKNYIKEDEVGGHVACTGEMRNLYKILVGKPEGRRPLRRPRHKEGSL
jgi:hypothetical protein